MDNHPAWCTHPDDEYMDESHVSVPVVCNPEGSELVSVAVELHRYWAPALGNVIGLEVMEDNKSRWYPLPAPQAQALHDALEGLLGLT
jgi:hypothetical protein